MCGIVGSIARRGVITGEALSRALVAMKHRGPDDSGLERVASVGDWDVHLGHVRLAIVDLSPTGHQPMTSIVRRDGIAAKGSIVFNGEIYNHADLRSTLSSREFASTGDTEVLLKGLLESGAEAFLPRANGMLAFGFWDASKQQLVLARDRVGKKPLYVYAANGVVAFASELKAFHAMGLPLTLNREALAYYHWLRHVPYELCIYEECSKLPAASHVTITLSPDGPRVGASVPYWDPLRACGNRYTRSFDAAIGEFNELLDDATRIRLEADVPVGIFLSAGIDSSLVAASACRVRRDPPTAFSIKAADPTFDESETAQATAKKLGMPCEVLELRFEDYQRQIERVPFHYDEPCAPLSQIPTMAIAEAARKRVTVVLTGDGGDEVFLGYPWLTYPSKLERVRRLLGPIPGGNQVASRFFRSGLGERAVRAAARVLGLNTANAAVKRELAIEVFEARSPAFLYDFFQQNQPLAFLEPSDRKLLGKKHLLERAKVAYPDYSWAAAEDRMLPELLGALEFVTAMRDEILVKVDRGTMAYSLEARSPLLDYRIVEFGFTIPAHFKQHDGVFKRLLRESCARSVDPDLSRRRKSGFGIPHPANMPPGPTPDVRWARAVELGWVKAWGIDGRSGSPAPRV